MKRLAILDDYQNVALSMADWASLKPEVAIDVLNAPLRGIDAAAAKLKDYEILIAMRERTPFPRALLERLPKLKLLVIDIDRRARDAPLGERLDQGLRVDERPARGVHEIGALLHRGDRGGIDDAARALAQHHMDSDDIGVGEERLFLDALDARFRGPFGREVRAPGDDLHVQRLAKA